MIDGAVGVVGETVNVTLPVADCPVLLKQLIEYVVVWEGLTVIEPEVGAETPPPGTELASQLLVFDEVQVRVDELPAVIDAGLTEREIDGEGKGASDSLTVTVT